MHRFFMNLSRGMAILGGGVLTALVVLVCVSILGRSMNTILHGAFFETNLTGFAQWALDLGIGPITGDFELVEAFIAFAIFAFLPLTQITGGHASVDIFTAWLSRRFNQVLGMVIELVFAFVMVIIALQLYEGMMSKMKSGTITFLLGMPLWWAYALSLVGASVAALVAVYVSFARVVETVTGQKILTEAGGAEH